MFNKTKKATDTFTIWSSIQFSPQFCYFTHFVLLILLFHLDLYSITYFARISLLLSSLGFYSNNNNGYTSEE
jgi:hypothetical protein